MRVEGCDTGDRGWSRLISVLTALIAAVAMILALSASARAANCALADFSYDGICGPEFESPAWGDAAGWTDPSKYSTIQLADITGNGTNELIARNDDGLEIWTFDTTVGQWRPAIGANGLPEVLQDFHSPLATDDVRGSWRDPAASSTIQTADLYGDGETEIIADHEPTGTRVWRYTPPTGTKNINGGSWSLVSTNNILPSTPAPSQYLSLHAVSAGVFPSAVLTDQASNWTWNANTGGFTPWGNPTLAPNSSSPQYYLDNMSGPMPEILTTSPPALVSANVYRTSNGVAAQWFTGTQWLQLGPPPTSGGQCQATHSCSPFPDTNCPAATGCFGSDPSYYETMRVASNLLGSDDPNGYVLGRLHDGLHVYALTTYTSASGQTYQGWDDSIPVLTALADPSSGFPPPGEWSSIRTGDITGDGHTDVLALVNGQLRAWELTSNGSGQLAWTALPATPSLNLGGSMWDNNASYYSTIQVGSVAGLRTPDAVIARGPFGVRTWFYNRNGSGGWTSFLPQDISSYPQFAGGQALAWTELNALARQAKLIGPSPSGTVRDGWTGATAPTDNDLTNLENGVLVFAGCTGQTSANPPTYSSCALPAGSSGFTAADWTAVVNETLAEIYDATQANDFFAQLQGLNSDTFLAKEAELPAIGSSVSALGQAAGNNTTTVSLQGIFDNGLEIAGALAGLANPVAGAALGIASYIAGIIPSATPELNAPPFNTTLNQLQNDLASAVTDAAKAVDEQSFEVRQSYSMLRLVAQLTGPSGPWHAINDAGLQGSMDEGFALWAYKQLLPTVLERDIITSCNAGGGTEGNDYYYSCSMSPFSGAIGSAPSFTTLNSPHTTNQDAYHAYPCGANWSGNFTCTYNQPPTAEVNGQPGSDIATKVWGPLSDTCNFNGDPLTEWTFDCNLGVNPAISTDPVGGLANGWNFTTCTASPMLVSSSDGVVDLGSCSNSISAQATVGSSGSVKLTAAVGLPTGFRLRTATLIDNRFLHEARGRGNLLTLSSGHPLGKIRLSTAEGKLGTRTGSGRLGSPPGAPPITLTLHHTAHRAPQLALTLSKLGVAVPHACQKLPASVSLTSAPFTLETSLLVSDGHATYSVSLPSEWTCVRNHGGGIIGLRTVTPPFPARRRGLALSLTGPSAVIPGSVATYTIRVHNTRRGPSNPYISSLWHILVGAGLSPTNNRKTIAIPGPRPTIRRLTQLRRGHTMFLRVRLRIPNGLLHASIHRVCVAASAIADSARPAGARACSAVRAAPTSPTVGLG
jgi:hypothetical protein